MIKARTDVFSFVKTGLTVTPSVLPRTVESLKCEHVIKCKASMMLFCASLLFYPHLAYQLAIRCAEDQIPL